MNKIQTFRHLQGTYTDRSHSKNHFSNSGGSKCIKPQNLEINFFTVIILSHIYYVHEQVKAWENKNKKNVGVP
jgi:hypothetical protein